MSKNKEDVKDGLWGIKVDNIPQDSNLYLKNNPSDKIKLVTPQIATLGTGSDINKHLANLKYILEDIVAGDNNALNRPEFQALNFPAIKKALEWLIKTDQLSDRAKADLLTDAWRLNFKIKPPTPAEFLTEKYIGAQAETLFKPVKDAFIECMDPLSPYRTVVLSLHIGWGKDQPLDAKVYTSKDSFKLMKDVHPGDKVLHPSGSLTEVVAIQYWNINDVYELELESGKKMRCGPHHLHHVSYNKNIWNTVETTFLLENKHLDFYFNVYDSVPEKLKKVIYIGKMPTKCINVANPDGLYITNDGIVTHNSLLTVLANLYTAVHFALMWHPYRFFAHSPATVYTQVFCAWSLKKGSELLLEPMIQLLEASPYFKKIRTHSEMIDLSHDEEIADQMLYTSASKTSALAIQNGANFKLISSPGGLLGQSQPLDVNVTLANGQTKKMGDLKIGEKLYSPTEGEQILLGIFPQGIKECYEITLSNGKISKYSPDHLFKCIHNNIWQIKPLSFVLENNCKIFPNESIIKVKKLNDCEQQCIYVSSKDHLYESDGIISHNSILQGSMTELAFFTDEGWSDDEILKFFTKLRQRIDSRFHGNYYAKFFLDSSPNSLESVIDDWIWNSAPKDPKNYILTGSRWKYFPQDFPEFFDKDKNEKHDFINGFPLYKGGSGIITKVVETETELSTYEAQDIIWCPVKQITNSGVINFRDNARENPIEFMRDWCGMPSGAADRILYNREWITHAFDTPLKNVFASIIALTDDEPEHLIWNQVKDIFFNKLINKYYYYYEPSLHRVASVDLSISGDAAAISVSHVERDMTRVDAIGQPLKIYVTDFTIPVIPKGGLINLDAFKFFILDLINLGNMNIRHVSFDGFQSVPIRQALIRAGVTVDYISVDKETAPYLSFIDYITHKRWYCGKNIMLKNNLLALQMTKRKVSKTTKIDHSNGDLVFSDNFCPYNGFYTENAWNNSKIGQNAKDVADAVCANINLLDTYADEFPMLHAWNPTVELERTYNSELNKTKEIIQKLNLIL